MRNRIMTAAIQEINENGIKFTMADLAKRLAVSKSTLYTHFSSKEEMISAIMDLIITNMQEQDEEIVNDQALDLEGKLKLILIKDVEILGPIGNRFIIDLKRYFPEEWKKTEKFQERKWQLIEGILSQGIIAGDFAPVDISITKVIFNSTINELLNQNFLMHSNLTLNDALSRMADVLCFGIVRVNHNKK